MLVFSELFPYRHEGKISVSFAAWRHSFFNPQAYTFCKLLLATRAVSSGYTVLSGPRCTKHPRDTVSVFRARRKDCQNRLFCSGSLSGSYSSCCWVWGGVPSAATVSCATSIAAGAEEILVLAGTHPLQGRVNRSRSVLPFCLSPVLPGKTGLDGLAFSFRRCGDVHRGSGIFSALLEILYEVGVPFVGVLRTRLVDGLCLKACGELSPGVDGNYEPV